MSSSWLLAWYSEPSYDAVYDGDNDDNDDNGVDEYLDDDAAANDDDHDDHDDGDGDGDYEMFMLIIITYPSILTTTSITAHICGSCSRSSKDAAGAVARAGAAGEVAVHIVRFCRELWLARANTFMSTSENRSATVVRVNAPGD